MAEICTDCRLYKTSQTSSGLYSCNKLMGKGASDARIMFVFDFISDEEVKSKTPAVGLMGQMVKRAAHSAGINADDCYYTYLAKCKPSADAPASKTEINACLKYLDAEIEQIKPKVIVAVGGTVANALGIKGTITNIHGQVFFNNKYNANIISIYHPAYVNNFVEQARQRKEWQQDLGKVVDLASGKQAEVLKVKYEHAKTIDDVKRIVDILVSKEWISFDTETTGLRYFKDDIVIVSFAVASGEGYAIPYKYPGKWNDEEFKFVKSELRRVLESRTVKKILQNGKFDLQFCFKEGIEVSGFAFDTMLAHYLLDENSPHGLGSIAPIYTDMGNYKDETTDYFEGKVKILKDGVTEEEIDDKTYYHLNGEEIKKSEAFRIANIFDCPYEQLVEYAIRDADATYRLFLKFWTLLEQENLLNLLVKIMTPLSYVLSKMEYNGIKGDAEYVEKMTEKFEKDLKALRESICNSIQVKKYLEKYNHSSKVSKTEVKKMGFDWDVVFPKLLEAKYITDTKQVTPKFDGFSNEFKAQLEGYEVEQFDELEDYLYESLGQFNINSPKQKSNLLYDIMGLKPLKTNILTKKQKEKGQKTGNPSTDNDALKLLLAENKIKLLEDIITYGQIKKFKEYVADYKLLLQDSPDGRIHTSYSLSTTKTGRMSSSRPNLQNIPKHDPVKSLLIRRTFVAREGYSLVEADYSQIEFKVWGHCSEDPALISSINSVGKDIHFRIAAQVYKLDVEKVTKEQRGMAKQVVYGMIYGRSAWSIAKEFGMTQDEVNRFMNGFFSAFPKATSWIERNIALMEKQGYLVNLVGRRRRATDIFSKVKELKEAAQRQARNFPLQSGAAELMYQAMIKIYRALLPYNTVGQEVIVQGKTIKVEEPLARMLLQIHDSLIFEIRDDLVTTIVPLIQHQMENSMELKCATTAEVEIGKNLGEMRKYDPADPVYNVNNATTPTQ